MLDVTVPAAPKRDQATVLAVTLNGQDRRGTLEWLAGIPPHRARQVSQATRDTAVKEFMATLRGLTEQWIASGKEQLRTIGEQSYARNCFWRSDGYQEPIERTLEKFLDRHPLPIVPDSSGKFAVAYSDPRGPASDYSPGDLAIYEFQQFLASDCPQRLFRCANCNAYFALSRKPREVIQRGAFCKDCKSAGRVRGIQEKRTAKREEMMNVAAKAWSEWTPRKQMAQKAWVVQAVRKKQCGWMIEIKWVSRNLKEILARVEAQGNGKG